MRGLPSRAAACGQRLASLTVGPLPLAVAPYCRKLAELEEQLIEAETTARVQAWVESKVTDALGSDVVQRSLQQRLEQERKLLEQQVRSLPQTVLEPAGMPAVHQTP